MNDLISREALKKALYDFLSENSTTCDWEDIFNVIDNAPAVNVKDQIAGAYNEGYMCGNKEAEKARPQGEWITVHFSREELNVPQKASMFDFVKCPFCETIHQGRHNFCSWCGADMRKGGAE